MGFKIAIAGATGNVGREMLNILEERGFPAAECLRNNGDKIVVVIQFSVLTGFG